MAAEPAAPFPHSARRVSVQRPTATPAADATGARGGAGAAYPLVWLGAPAPGGLTLPAANPTAAQLYAPRGVWLDTERLIVADTGNHRVLIWHGVPERSHGDADVVLGQPDFLTEGAQAGGRGPERGMRLPTGVIVVDGQLVVADAWNHRLLIWDEVPTASDTAPDRVIGQADLASVTENRGGPCGPDRFWWPFGLAMIGDRLHVADTGNRRVVAFAGVPDTGQPHSFVLGQPDAHQRDENRGLLGPASFRWVHDLCVAPDDACAEAGAGDPGAGPTLFVADAGNHRILGWDPPPSGDGPATFVLGQPDFTSAGEFPYQPQTASALRFPYALDSGAGRLVVADTANNRILVWDEVPAAGGVPADRVLGQSDFAANGENRWDAVRLDTFCWPYGLSVCGDRVAVADSGNNRVVVWTLA